MKGLLVVTVLSLTLLVTGSPHAGSSISNQVVKGFFDGRSGNMIVTSNVDASAEVRQDAAVFFHSADSSLLKADEQAQQLSFESVANILAGALGVHSTDDEQSLPFVQTSRPVSAGLVIAIDSVSSADVKDFALNNLAALQAASAKSQLSSASYPQNSVNLLESAFTGVSPSVHGIIASSWKDKNGKDVTAFVDEQSTAQVANVADLVAQTFNGESLILSVSSDAALAHTFAVHPSLTKENPEWLSNVCFSYDSASNAWTTGASPSTHFIAQEVVQKFDVASLDSLSVDNVVVKSDAANQKVDVTFPIVELGVHTTQTASFNLADKVDASLFAELSFFSSIAALLEQKSAAKASSPDLINFSFASVASVTQKYGQRSAARAAALNLIDAHVPRIIASINKAYNSNVIEMVMLLGRESSISTASKQAAISVIEKAASINGVQVDCNMFPNVYINGEDANIMKMCADVQSTADVSIICPQVEMDRSFSSRFESLASIKEQSEVHPQSHMSLQDVINGKSVAGLPPAKYTFINYDCKRNGAGNSTYPSCKSLRRYQVTLWLCISLVLIALLSFCALCNMPFKKDTLLYGNMNPAWSKKNH